MIVKHPASAAVPKLIQKRCYTKHNPFGDPKDWLHGGNYYEWHYSIARAAAPARILEIGVLYGYSAVAMIQGAIDAGTPNPEFIGIDRCFQDPKSNERAEAGLKMAFQKRGWSNFRIEDREGDQVYDLGEFDLIHVDADHDSPLSTSQFVAAWAQLKPGGWCLIDDWGSADKGDHKGYQVRNTSKVLYDLYFKGEAETMTNINSHTGQMLVRKSLGS